MKKKKGTQITKQSLIDYGFELSIDCTDFHLLRLSIKNWSILYEAKCSRPYEFILEADGGNWSSGSFDLSHFEYIEQIDNLVNALNGTIKSAQEYEAFVIEDNEVSKIDCEFIKK